MDTLIEPSHRDAVAALKRVWELWTLDQVFHEAYLDDPERALVATGLDVDPVAVSLILLGRTPAGKDKPDDLTQSFVWYREFVESRFERNMRRRVLDVPTDPRFRDWRERQMRRCQSEMGSQALFISHMSVAYELTCGCSIGCPFCALAAGRLEGVFRHTPENAALWRDVLFRLHALIGEPASRACCYYATEPLDNPDYELFLKDFYDEFGQVPQTTTAASTRDLDRTARLLSWGQQAFPHFDRISVVSECDRDALLGTFSPEDLILTDLLPQFREAPIHYLKRAGRNLDDDDGMGGTVACVSGFVVNMCDRTVRLVTPTKADQEHPTGEIVLDRAAFSDAAELEDVARTMISHHMHETIGLADVLFRPKA